MKENLMPKTPSNERLNKKVKRKAPNTAEQQVPRFASKSSETVSPSAQQSPSTLHSSTIIAETPLRNTSITVTASDLTNGHNPEASLEDSSTPLTVLPSRLKHLTSKYRFAQMTIKNGAKVEKKVRTLIEFMSRFSYLDPSIKPGVVALRAESDSVNKLISVVEIAKREIEAMERGGKWWQYNELDSEVKEIPRNKVKKKKAEGGERKVILNGKGGRTLNESITEHAPNAGEKSEDLMTAAEIAQADDEGEDEEAFETMVQPQNRMDAPNTKLRSIPILAIYMSRVPVPEMKAEFSEQTNAPT